MKRIISIAMSVILIISALTVCSFAGFYTGAGAINLPTAAQGDGILVGFTSTVGENTVFLAPGANYTAQTPMTFEPVFVKLATTSGASVRTASPVGLRFTSEVDTAGYNALCSVATDFSFGTIIAPTDYISDDFTQEALSASGKTALDVPVNVWWAENDETRQFTAVISQIKTENYARDFASRAYLDIKYTDGTSARYYGGYSAENNARSVSFVASKALSDGKLTLTEQVKSVLSSYLVKIPEISVSLTLPVVGAAPAPAYSGIENAGYTVNTEWICQNINPIPATFIDAAGFQATMTVTPKDGYIITDDTVLTFNGEPLTKAYTVENNTLTILRRYPLGGYTWAY